MAYPKTFDQATAYEEGARLLLKVHRANAKKDRSKATLAHLKKMQKLVPPGLYRHFKGGMYQVFGVLEDVNTGVCYVDYAADYGLYKGERALRVLVGGPNSFLRPIHRKAYHGVRFTRIS